MSLATAHAGELESPPALALDTTTSLAAGNDGARVATTDVAQRPLLFGQTLPRGFLPGFDRGLATASSATGDTRLQAERRVFEQRRPLTYMNNLLRLDY